MRDPGGGGGGGEFVALRPEPAEELAGVMQRAGDEAADLLERVGRALEAGGESAPAAVQALHDAAAWGPQAAADLRWRIQAMVALDRSFLTSGGMVAGVLAFASRDEFEQATQAAEERLDRVLADPQLRGDPAATADAVARWAAGLAPGVLDGVALQAPGLLGNLDGIPPATRYAINARTVTAELARVDALLAGPLDPRRREELETRREALAALSAPRADGRDRQLLALDPAGDGKAIEVIGDLAGADHVAVLVPGMGSDLDGFPALASNAYDLQQRAEYRASPGQQVATIAWLGYDAPDAEVQAAQTDAARQAAPQLVGFLAGQRLGAQVHTTVIGHSYGSVVTGHALAAGLAVGDAVVIGSPGVGQGVTAGDLRPDGGELYAMRTADDPIRYFDGHGGDPVNADFGAVVLAANPASPGSGHDTIFGHSAYYTPGSLALDNLAAVTVNQPDLLIAQTDPLPNPISAGPFIELPTTAADSFQEALDDLAETLDEYQKP